MSNSPLNLAAELTAADLERPAVSLAGEVDHQMYGAFRRQLSEAPQEGLVVIELSTLGGDPEIARMMGEDIRFQSERRPSQRMVFLGKTAVYSAGATLLGFFALQNRYLTRGTRLMIHERKLEKTLKIDGPLSSCLAPVQALLNEIETSITIQNEGFENLIQGSRVTLGEIVARAPSNWYLTAEEAREHGLVHAVV